MITTMDGIELPEVNQTDPAQLEAWFGNFGHFDLYRKCVLANCKEMIRAEYTVKQEKITETRLDDLARIHPNYLEFLADGLKGRGLREQNVIDSLHPAGR